MAAELKFEEALKKLEKIVGDLENGSLSLDSALEKYQEGIELSRLCSRKLEAAKKKVEILIKSSDGTVHAAPFDPSALSESDDGAAQGQARKKKTKGDSGLF